MQWIDWARLLVKSSRGHVEVLGLRDRRTGKYGLCHFLPRFSIVDFPNRLNLEEILIEN
jgi:hypothetical protein